MKNKKERVFREHTNIYWPDPPAPFSKKVMIALQDPLQVKFHAFMLAERAKRAGALLADGFASAPLSANTQAPKPERLPFSNPIKVKR